LMRCWLWCEAWRFAFTAFTMTGSDDAVAIAMAV
jgi:hypothetical protein